MKHLKIAKYLSLVLLASSIIGCSTNKIKTDPGAGYRQFSSAQLSDMGQKAMDKHRYSTAIKYYEALDALYPFNDNSEHAQRNLIFAYYKTRDYASAEAASERYLRVNAQSQHGDYIYYIKGLSQLNQNRTFLQRIFPVDIASRDMSTLQDAFYSFRDLLQFYPKSQYAPDARQHLIYLRNLFAQHELEIAKFYMQKGAYQAAVNRADGIIKQYQGTPQVEQALIILIKANRKLGLEDAADRAQTVLQTNFPHSNALKTLK